MEFYRGDAPPFTPKEQKEFANRVIRQGNPVIEMVIDAYQKNLAFLNKGNNDPALGVLVESLRGSLENAFGPVLPTVIKVCVSRYPFSNLAK